MWWPEQALHEAFVAAEGGPKPARVGGARRANTKGTRPRSTVAAIVCPICRTQTLDKVADHCHASGAVRDWLCRKCNAGLGFFNDNPEAMRAAAEYVELHRSDPTGLRVGLWRERQWRSTRHLQRRARRALVDRDRAISLGQMALPHGLDTAS